LLKILSPTARQAALSPKEEAAAKPTLNARITPVHISDIASQTAKQPARPAATLTFMDRRQTETCILRLVSRTIGAERGNAARGRPGHL
jgi:hypothetical protein